MMGLTARQRELLEFLRAHVKAHGVSPSFREIGARFGFRSNSAAQGRVRILESKGYIHIRPHRARGIELLQTEDHHLPDCVCDGCANVRYIAQLKLVQSLKVDPPVIIAQVIAAGRGTNLRNLDPITRAHLIGAEPRKAAPRTRTAVPRSAS